MVSTHVELTEEQMSDLAALAARRGVSVEALLHEAVEHLLKECEMDVKWARLLATAGRFDSGYTDISVNHDRYLEEDFGD